MCTIWEKQLFWWLKKSFRSLFHIIMSLHAKIYAGGAFALQTKTVLDKEPTVGIPNLFALLCIRVDLTHSPGDYINTYSMSIVTFHSIQT